VSIKCRNYCCFSISEIQGWIINRSIESSELPETSESIVELYPNPTSTELFVKYNKDVDYTITVNIYNSQLGFIESYELPSNTLINVDVSSLEPGVYFVEIYDDQSKRHIKMKKFIKL